MMYGGDIDWDVSLHDFADFHGKQIARRLTAQSKGGPQLTAQITLLEDLGAPDVSCLQSKRRRRKKNNCA